MHKKVVIIIAIAVGILIIASGVVGTIIAINHNNAQVAAPMAATVDTDPAKQEAQTTPDLSVDLGACTVVSQNTISEALKPAIAEVRDANNRGFGYEGNGDRSQSCVYAFSAQDNLNNRLTVTVTEFSNEKNKNDAILGFEDNAVVSGVGDKAYSASGTDDLTKQTNYSLFVIKDMKLYSFIILQQSDSDKFTTSTAGETLITIAKAIK